MKQVDITEFNYDIESKGFITRGETEDQFYKHHINQPMIEKKAKVARSIAKEDSNHIYDRTRGGKNKITTRCTKRQSEEIVDKNAIKTGYSDGGIRIMVEEITEKAKGQGGTRLFNQSQGPGQLEEINEVSFDLGGQ